MAVLDVEKLLQEISADSPCGDDLEYDPDFQQLELAAQHKEAQEFGDSVVEGTEADWRAVKKSALSLLSRTKDLRVAVYLARASLHQDGFRGFSDSMLLLKELLEQYWDCVHPQLDPDDNNDPTFRVNTLSALCDPESVLLTIRKTPVVNVNAIGTFSVRDIDISKGLLSPVSQDGEGEAGQDLALIDAAFMEVDLEELQDTADAVNSCIDCIHSIETIFTEKVSAAQSPNLEETTKLLKHVSNELAEPLQRRGVSEVAEGSEEAGEAQMTNNSVAISGEIRSREDVIRTIDRICEYYKKNEPSSPIPLILQRAKRLARKDFMEILKDIAPDAVKQAELVSGEKE